MAAEAGHREAGTTATIATAAPPPPPSSPPDAALTSRAAAAAAKAAAVARFQPRSDPSAWEVVEMKALGGADLESKANCRSCAKPSAEWAFLACGAVNDPHELCRQCFIDHVKNRHIGRSCPFCRWPMVTTEQQWLHGTRPTWEQVRLPLYTKIDATRSSLATLPMAARIIPRGTASQEAPHAADTLQHLGVFACRRCRHCPSCGPGDCCLGQGAAQIGQATPWWFGRDMRKEGEAH